MIEQVTESAPLEGTGWRIHHLSGPAGPFHAKVPSEDTGPQIWVQTIPRPALVLGSTQPDDLVYQDRAEADGIEVCRRRSGGGLVWIDPATDCWIDVIVPAGSPQWQTDVGRAFHWLGDLWAETLRRCGHSTPAPVVHRSAGRSPEGRVWCFADVGHGEVSIGGSKVVGLSQRRTRTWARMQCLVLGHWPADALTRYVNLDRALELAADTTRSQLQPHAVAAGFPAGSTAPEPTSLAAEFLTALVGK